MEFTRWFLALPPQYYTLPHLDDISSHFFSETLSMPKPYACQICPRRYKSAGGLTDHVRATQHDVTIWRSCQCAHCPRAFNSEYALGDHMRSLHPRVLKTKAQDAAGTATEDTHCLGCDKHFEDGAALKQHRVVMHNWCCSCSRDFASYTSLLQHLKSLAHAPREYDCPFCKKSYKSPSGIAHHIEAGCSNFTRHQVTAAVQAMDIVPQITTKRIEGVDPMMAAPVYTYIATPETFNGKSYSCFLCSRNFHSLPSLNKHSNSAAHDDNEFRCPKCKKQFTLISGFVQHLESRACGLAKDKQVEGYFNSLADQFSRLLKM